MTVVTSFPITLNPTSAYTALGAAPATGDLIPMVDISDPTQAITGTLKKMTVGNLFTSPTMTGTTTIDALNSVGRILFTGIGTPAAGTIYKGSDEGLALYGTTGLLFDFVLYNAAGTSVAVVPTGTRNLTMPAGHLSLTLGNLAVAAGTTSVQAFGCNGAAAQTAFASGGALAAYAAGGAGFDTAGHAAALYAMVVALRAALVANGIMS